VKQSKGRTVLTARFATHVFMKVGCTPPPIESCVGRASYSFNLWRATKTEWRIFSLGMLVS
jgi:hypothetical protein